MVHPLVEQTKQGQARYTRRELAPFLGIGQSTLDKHIAARLIAYDLWEGASRWFSRAEVIRFLAEHHLAPPAPRPKRPRVAKPKRNGAK